MCHRLQKAQVTGGLGRFKHQEAFSQAAAVSLLVGWQICTVARENREPGKWHVQTLPPSCSTLRSVVMLATQSVVHRSCGNAEPQLPPRPTDSDPAFEQICR
jgi:hypothetical protein